jgi:pyridoxal phosphate enzyme (YggS family)
MIEQLKSNLSSVRQRIGDAAQVAGRSAEDIRLVGVTKYVDAETTRALFEAGCTDLGESRPQSLWEKSDALADLQIRWHMIGHLQRNKVKRTIEKSVLIHSVDSQRLLNAIDVAGNEHDKRVNVLLEVNVSGEAAKHGFQPDQLAGAIESVASLEFVSVQGLMCMAGLAGDLGDAQREFELLRQLQEQHHSDTPDNVDLKELSMGMSGDFEIAIKAGATMVRIGSLLFEGV